MSWRRPRWPLALLAVMVALPMWTMPHGAVQAAAADAEFTRLGGPTRYSTAVRIAEAYLDHVDGLAGESRVDTVIMGSGLNEHLGWVAPVPMLARLERAPLVLTRPDEVPVPVAQFLQRRDIRKVILLGGTSVISADIEGELAELGVRIVERLGSDDVHLHAVAVAESFGRPPGEFGKHGRTAMLTTSSAFADALAAGPMAYQGEYPILITTRRRLPTAVFDYLVESDIEHLIILGGNAAVGTAVQQELSGLDFTISRIAGIDRYATAVELARAQLQENGLRPCFDGAELGLAYGVLPPDAISSGPLLGEMCAPLLLTPSDTLPRSVALFLRSDKWVTGDAQNDLSVTVFGGTTVVPTDVVTQFFERATTLVPIGGRISVELDPDTETTDEFTISFDSEVDAKKAAKAVELGMFQINYERVVDNCALNDDEIVVDLLHGCARVSLGRIVVGQLKRRVEDNGDSTTTRVSLEVGDLITVTGGQRIGLNNSPRPVARFSFVIPEPEEPIDHDAPEIEVIAPSGHSKIAVLVIEANPLNPPEVTDNLASLVTVVAADGRKKPLRSDVGQPGRRAGTRDSHDRYVFTLLDDTATLEPGDAITVPRGAFLDDDGRRSPSQRHVVTNHSTDFKIESVTIGDVESANTASVTLRANTQLNAQHTGSLTITARRDGIASGSRGNEWRIYGVGLPPTSDEAEEGPEDVDPEIGVAVNQSTRLIQYRVLAGEPTFADLAEALAADADFAANFTVETTGVNDGSGTIGGTVQAGRQFAGGGTAVGVRLLFSDPVQSVVGLADGSTDCVREATESAPGRALISLARELAPAFNARSDGCSLSFVAPDNIVYMRFNSPSAERLPARGDLVFINGSAATSYADTNNSNIAQGWLSIRYDPDVPVD
ncbi:cell wall-binding repeat-containing protein [Candidatus Poriferisodalis sp.]|uniref:cell wall-binding repeat-containing protein n=1 Tax=Candidatus Poriferisodalis sp. TaxID=3101277 RepID=UPI003B01FEE1